MNLTIPEGNQSSPLYVGSLTHKCLEYLYTGQDPLIPLAEAEAEINGNTVNALTGQDAVIVPMDRWEDIKLARLMIEGYVDYLETSGVDMGMTVISAEEEIEHSLGIIRGREVILHGKLDLRVQMADGLKYFFDHKTTTTFTEYQDRRIQLNEQLLTYSVLLRLAKGEIVDGAIFNLLKKNKRTARAKPPFYQREFVKFNAQQQENHHKHLLSTIENVLILEEKLQDQPLTTELAYPTVDKDCTWKCPFLPVCPMMDDGSDIEGALQNLYIQRELVV